MNQWDGLMTVLTVSCKSYLSADSFKSCSAPSAAGACTGRNFPPQKPVKFPPYGGFLRSKQRPVKRPVKPRCLPVWLEGKVAITLVWQFKVFFSSLWCTWQDLIFNYHTSHMISYPSLVSGCYIVGWLLYSHCKSVRPHHSPQEADI